MMLKIKKVMHEYMHNRGGACGALAGAGLIKTPKPSASKTVCTSNIGDVAEIDAARVSSVKHIASRIQTGATFTRTQSAPRSELH